MCHNNDIKLNGLFQCNIYKGKDSEKFRTKFSIIRDYLKKKQLNLTGFTLAEA